MGFRAEERGMIRGDHDAIVPGRFQKFVHRPHDVLVDLFQGLNLGGRISFVRGLITRFDVNNDEIDVGQRRNRCASFGGIICIQITGGAGHVDNPPTQQPADPP